MTNELDYNNEAVLNIINNPSYTDDQKKELFEKYKIDLQKARKNRIVSILNDLAKDITSITKEDYINCLKKYENDDLTKPFEVIEEELKSFADENKSKYENYLNSHELVDEKIVQDEPEINDITSEPSLEEIVPDVTPSMNIAENKEAIDEFDDTIFKDPEEFKQEITPSTFIENNEVSVLNEEPEILAKPLFKENSETTKDVMPDELSESLDEKGNASAIILSIIAIIIGAVVMYSIIRLK